MNHSEAWDLIPWLVNDRLDATARVQLQQHLEQCSECREEARSQEALLQAMTSAPRVEAMPPASLQKLWTRINADPAPRAPLPVYEATAPRLTTWHVAMVAGAALLTGASLTAALQALHAPPRGEFRTVTEAPPAAAGIRAVFDTAMSVGSLQALLERNGLQIVSGPSASGVYTLGGVAGGPVTDAALNALRADAQVRFAERVGG